MFTTSNNSQDNIFTDEKYISNGCNNKDKMSFEEKNKIDDKCKTYIGNNCYYSLENMYLVLYKYNQKRKINPQADIADIIDGDFLRLVYSFCQKCHEMEGDWKTFAEAIKLNYSYEFLLCLYKLDIGFDSFSGSWQEIANLYIDSGISSDQCLITMAFYDKKRPINVKLLYWLKNKEYFFKYDDGNLGHYVGNRLPYYGFQYKLLTIGTFIEQQNQGSNYEFDTYNDFLGFIKNNDYKDAIISVENLRDVLEKENRFLSKDEFTGFVSSKKLHMGSFFDFDEKRLLLSRTKY